MAIHIRDQTTDALVRALARRRCVSLTEAVRVADSAELQRDEKSASFMERIREIQDEVARWPDSGLKADKAFFDELSGDED